MAGWLERRGRDKRATAYLRSHPEDAPAVKAILTILDTPIGQDVGGAREVVEMLLGREVLHDEWQGLKTRWERAWSHIVLASDPL